MTPISHLHKNSPGNIIFKLINDLEYDPEIKFNFKKFKRPILVKIFLKIINLIDRKILSSNYRSYKVFLRLMILIINNKIKN